MSEINDILNSPYQRTKAMYHFKVVSITDNTIQYHDASRVTHTVELPNTTDYSLEYQYKDQRDNLFIAVSITGQYFFYSKASNEGQWPGFIV